MNYYYSEMRNVQILIYLLKYYGIKKIIASPGQCNVPFVSSVQQDDFFEIYSCVDERSAAYLAVGMAEESGEQVVISCTGATASRNYMSAMTEAYYRKLPIIVVTSSHDDVSRGHLIAQVTDRSTPPSDVAVVSYGLPCVVSKEDEWDCVIKINRGLQLYKIQPGPVHFNLMRDRGPAGNSIQELPPARTIVLYKKGEELPLLESNKKVAIFIGSHRRFFEKEVKAIERFCEVHNAVVFSDHTGGYKGKYLIHYALLGAQETLRYDLGEIDCLIHIGEISGDYDTLQKITPKEVWRVSEDGMFRDTFKKLKKVFYMSELEFFSNYNMGDSFITSYYEEVREKYNELRDGIPEMPLSNIYVANILSKTIPTDCTLYLGILHTLRSWNYFELPSSIDTVSNVGGFGIDGIVSSMIGASLCNKEKLYFAILGDLSFFYDMNSIGQRDLSNNVRILVVNNGHGQEFQFYNRASAFMGEDVNRFVAAAGHYGNKSRELVKHYVQDLGFDYYSATTKDEFNEAYKHFIDSSVVEKPILLEVFTDNNDENEALRTIRNIEVDETANTKQKLKRVIKGISSLVTNKK